jgi:hypothetical protein
LAGACRARLATRQLEIVELPHIRIKVLVRHRIISYRTRPFHTNHKRISMDCLISILASILLEMMASQQVKEVTSVASILLPWLAMKQHEWPKMSCS